MHWLITSTTYGTWLPGDRRGSITSVRDYRFADNSRETRVEHDQPGTPCEPQIPGLERSAVTLMKSSPVLLSVSQASLIARQLSETARLRAWQLLAASVMSNHFHLVVGVDDAVAPTKILGDFKAWASRALTQDAGQRPRARWFTTGGSTRALTTDRAVEAAVHYVLQRQASALAAIDSARRAKGFSPGNGDQRAGERQLPE